MLPDTTKRATAARHALLTADARPPKSDVVADAVPDAIRGKKRWVCWEWKRANGKWTKRPIQPNGKAASSIDPRTWTTYTAAMLGHQGSPDVAGVGFMLGGGYAGVDLDGCVDPETGEADPYVAEVTERLDSYTEISPSKTGVKILVRGAKPKGRTQSRADAPHDCECYDGGRFFTITGQRWPNTPKAVEHRTEALEWFFFRFIETKKKTPSRPESVSVDRGGDEVEAAREALANIPATYASTYEDWVRVGIACRSVHPTSLLDDWVAWSRDGKGYAGDDDCREKWEKLPTDGQVGIGTLVYLAKLSGWKPPRKVRVRKQRQDTSDANGGDQAAEQSGEQKQRPEVLISLDEGCVADQVVRHLGALGWDSPWVPEFSREAVKVYSRGGQLVHAVPSEDPNIRGQLIIRPLPLAITRERITQACQVTVEKEVKDEVEIEPTRPPKWLVDAVHVRGWYAGYIRSLTGIIAAPTIRPDGSIVQTPGWDPATGLLYRPATAFPPIPDNPTRGDARAAIDELVEVVADFPFVDDADRSAWVCIVLSMIGRCCVSGCVPMFAITANIRGSGKSLLVDSASLIAYGRPAARQAFTRDDDEMRKVITTVAIEAVPSVLFDNLNIQLGGAALDAALTSIEWTGRVLGKSQSTGDLPMRTVWAATGNNMAFGSDVARRVLPVRLQSPLEEPESRTDFRHPDLLAWVMENRPRLAVAALTVLRAYYVAGRPELDGGQWGSFEAWSRTIRGSVAWAGAADPLPTRRSATANDDSRALLTMLIAGIKEADPDGVGINTKEIERLTSHRPDEPPTCPALTEAVSHICGTKFNARRFGNRVRAYVGRVWEGWKIEKDTGHAGFSRWKVVPADGGSGGSGESGFTHLTREAVESNCIRDADTTLAYRERPKPNSPKSPDPPSQQSPPGTCPSCGGQMVRLPGTPEVRGWVNLDCVTPDCEHVQPVRMTEI